MATDMITEYERAMDDTDIVVARVRARVLASIAHTDDNSAS